MTPRRAKRYINQANDWIVFANEINANSEHTFRVIMSRDEAWEIILNLACNQYSVRETLREIVRLADEVQDPNSNPPDLENNKE